MGAVLIGEAHQFDLGGTLSAASWLCGNQWDGRLQMEPNDEAVFPSTRWKGVILDVSGGERAVFDIETAKGAASVRPREVPFQRMLDLLDGRILVERAPPLRRLSQGMADDDYSAVAIGPDGRVWVAWISFADGADIIQLRSSPNATDWGPAQSISHPGDYQHLSLVSTEPGTSTAVASAIQDGVLRLFKAEYSVGGEPTGATFTHGPGPDAFPRMAAAQNGEVYLVYRSGSDSNTDTSLRVRREGAWRESVRVASHPANDWEPAVALN